MSVIIVKDSVADLREKAPILFDASLIVSIFIMAMFFFFSRGPLSDKKVVSSLDEKVEIIEIPPTEQLTRPPPPARPSIPVEAEDEEEIDEVTIDDTEVDLTEEVPDIAEEEEEELIEFFAVQKKPTIVKAAAVVYPEIARKAGVEAMVVVNFIVSVEGKPENIKILKGHPMLNDAAIEAVKKYVFSPGMQRDKPVAVKWQIPIRFRLNN
jgi:protein TonB